MPAYYLMHGERRRTLVLKLVHCSVFFHVMSHPHFLLFLAAVPFASLWWSAVLRRRTYVPEVRRIQLTFPSAVVKRSFFTQLIFRSRVPSVVPVTVDTSLSKLVRRRCQFFAAYFRRNRAERRGQLISESRVNPGLRIFVLIRQMFTRDDD